VVTDAATVIDAGAGGPGSWSLSGVAFDPKPIPGDWPATVDGWGKHLNTLTTTDAIGAFRSEIRVYLIGLRAANLELYTAAEYKIRERREQVSAA
jgi:hypothetical protein